MAVLRSLQLLDTSPEERFDRHTRLARRLFDVPIAAVSLVDSSRQYFKSIDGLEVRQTGRAESFCGHTILQADAMVVNDALADTRFIDNPLVTGSPDIRFYAGVPLVVQGQPIGTLCIIDRQSRELSAEDLASLTDLAGMVAAEMQTLHEATTDTLTGLCNQRGLANAARHLFRADDHHSDLLGPLAIVTIDLDHFKAINDGFGHDAGDRALKAMADILKQVFRGSDWSARQGGDEFCVLSCRSGPLAVQRQLERLDEAVRAFNRGQRAGSWKLAYSAGFAVRTPEIADLDALLCVADGAMYDQKAVHHANATPWGAA